ncbi:ABC transporter ATP-binding protein [Hyperthermus butylicus]|uniref:Nitrate transport ATP-binding protein n=1 Tax=Hyperthermus butylicus (strain DSM 5456 / JCM 9403 / PLM1-5) TaxID=415426 RepID=A2BMR4_HYPBU|nr:ATP-binding cassette domain-containing protein [Hyperthermus butylicus]ABM81275.1 Nitrate transport ATP-binding protein [Hyperthermus butylicus DSM 5456]
MGDAAETVVEATDVWKSFNGITVLAGVSVYARRGEVVGIVGPNGCGKTTLLRIIAGLEKPDRGRVFVKGRVLLVFQENLLLPWRRLRDNIALGLLYRGVSRRKAMEIVESVAGMLGIVEHLDKYPGEVSGGTARKAAIARMLVLGPDILLLDEPLAGLDVESRRSLGEAIRRIAASGKTVILVDHNLDEASRIADRVYVLTNPPTRVEAVVDLRDVPPGERPAALYEALSRAARRREG